MAKSAKSCPSCGQKLKMGFLAKLGIGLVGIIIIVVASMPSSEDIAKKLAEVENTTPSTLSPSGDLASMFSMISDATDIQRDNTKKEISGQVVEWRLSVFDVDKVSKDGNVYKIQTSGGSNSVGTFVRVYARDSAEAEKIEAIKPGTMITVKGEINGIFMRNIEIEHARITSF